MFVVPVAVLSTYFLACNLNFGFDPESQTLARKRTAFTPVPYIKNLLDYAKTRNIAISVISGGNTGVAKYVENDLIAAYPDNTVQIKLMFARNLAFFTGDLYINSPTANLKNILRQDLVNAGYTIILTIGDQFSDLNYVYPNQHSSMCSYKLPSYMYYIK